MCGKRYEACHTPNTTGVFRWRDVACSIECGRIYLERIEQSRKPAIDATQDVPFDSGATSATVQDGAEAIEDTDNESSADIPADVEDDKKRRSSKKEKAAL